MYSNPSVIEPCGVIPSGVTALVMVMSAFPGMLAGAVTVIDVTLFQVISVAV